MTETKDIIDRESAEHFLHFFDLLINPGETTAQLFLTKLQLINFLLHHFHEVIMVIESPLQFFLKLGHVKFKVPFSFFDPNLEDRGKPSPLIFEVEESEFIL